MTNRVLIPRRCDASRKPAHCSASREITKHLRLDRPGALKERLGGGDWPELDQVRQEHGPLLRTPGATGDAAQQLSHARGINPRVGIDQQHIVLRCAARADPLNAPAHLLAISPVEARVVEMERPTAL